jgi:SAM-dependent methyltransferase
MANDEQLKHWNSDEASHWVSHQLSYDAMLAPFGDRLLGAVSLAPTDRVLDVGCGCGATTLAAGRLASSGSATGVDLSEAMLDVARRRATEASLSNVSFEQGDAQTFPFSDTSFELVISRFGVMFFDDPVAAFTNLAKALVRRGQMAFVCWQELARNPFVLVPGMAIAEHVELPDLGPEGAPGMFALADPSRVRSVLAEAGLIDVTVGPLAEEILLGGGGSLNDAVQFLRYGGMGRAVLDGVDETAQHRAEAAVTDELAPYLSAEGVRIGSAAWLVTAIKP